MCLVVCRATALHRDSGVKAIEQLMEKRGKFDYILLETTGLADPGRFVQGTCILQVALLLSWSTRVLPLHIAGPIISMFWMDSGLCSDLYLSGVVTLVDTKHGLQHLAGHEDNEAVRQVALADVAVLNKLDLASEQDLEGTRQAVRWAGPMLSVWVGPGHVLPCLSSGGSTTLRR